MKATEYNNVLAIDTATRRLNLALRFGGDRLVKTSEAVEKTHGQIILKKVADLFVSAGGRVDDLQAIVVCLGPGSFTGLRIGLAAAKGMAVARDLPTVGVSLFEVAALRLAAVAPARVLIPSRRGEYYTARIESDGLVAESVRVTPEADLAGLIGRDQAYGVEFDPAASLASVIPGLTGLRLEYDAADLLQVGLAKLPEATSGELVELEPLYLQKAIAEVRFDRRSREQS